MLRASDLLESMRGRAANDNLGSGRVRDHRRREIERRSYSPVFGSWRNSGAARVVVEDGELEERPGGKAKLLGCLARALVRRGGVVAAAQRSGAGQSCVEAAARVCGGLWRGGESAGGSAGFKEGRTEDLGEGAGMEGSRRSRPDSAARRGTREEGDDPDLWVRPGSEGEETTRV
jgi:hypothetical protein